MTKHYYLHINNQQLGPLPYNELLLNGLTEDTLVWSEGMTNWLPAKQLAELSSLLSGTTNSLLSDTEDINGNQSNNVAYSRHQEDIISEHSSAAITQLQKPNSYLKSNIFMAVLSTIFCSVLSLISSIIGLVKSCKVKTAITINNYEAAKKYSRQAKTMFFGSLGLFILSLIIMSFFSGGGIDIGQLGGMLGGGMAETQQEENKEFSPEEQELAKFSLQILAGTEDVWTKIFREEGLGEYKPPKLVLYSGATSTACGTGQSAMGPFYCSGDQSLYIDLSFFMQMKQQLGADGDFAYAYVIAHEVGHHVEYLTGTLQKAHIQMQQYGQNSAKSNAVSVRLELLADFYAGVWAHHDNKEFQSLEDGDLEEAIDCAQKIGDDYLQKRARGQAVPESFTHGTSQQRMKWLKLGLRTGDIRQGRTFEVPDYQL